MDCTGSFSGQEKEVKVKEKEKEQEEDADVLECEASNGQLREGEK